jgi:hypothetical protein
MRRLLFVVAIAGCAPHAAPSGLAWPKPSTTASDGGESIAPRESRPVAAAIEKSDEDVKPAATPVAEKPAIAAPAKEGGGAPAIAAPAGAVEEVITTDDIVIEIDD